MECNKTAIVVVIQKLILTENAENKTIPWKLL
jgi:hypothetical protein